MSFTVNRLKQINALSTFKDSLSIATNNDKKLYNTTSPYLLKFTKLIAHLQSDNRSEFVINGQIDFGILFRNVFPFGVGEHGADYQVYHVFKDLANIVQTHHDNESNLNDKLQEYINNTIEKSM